jgi:putative transposase
MQRRVDAYGHNAGMPQSLSRILVHLVFSTKGRTPWLTSEIQPELHRYISGTLNAQKCVTIQIGGHVDHIHAFFGLARTITVAQLVEDIKTSSSKWIKTKDPAFADFHWQKGYGAFSIGYLDADTVVSYIRNQEEHHRQTPYQDEFRNLMRQNNVEFDERYMWD